MKKTTVTKDVKKANVVANEALAQVGMTDGNYFRETTVKFYTDYATLQFQDGKVSRHGRNGFTNKVVLSAVYLRLSHSKKAAKYKKAIAALAKAIISL